MIPVVLHHGMFGFGQISAGPIQLSYFRGIDRALAAKGHPLIVSRVHPTAAIATRARQLKETILRQLQILGREDEKVLLVAHSMGGLDARYMISKLGMDDRVAALLTVTSPHRGSPLADWCLKHLANRLGAYKFLNFLGLDVQGAVDVTTTGCARFNEEVPDAPGVKYFSVSAARPWQKIPAFALPMWRIIYDVEGDNDSLVSVKSSIWGKHLGVWPADHFHTINKRFVIELKDPTGDIAPYWVRAVEQVVREVENAKSQVPMTNPPPRSGK
jgi:triacylglycerol lipase